MRYIFALCFLLTFPIISSAQALEIKSPIQQGSLIEGHVTPGQTITVNGDAVLVNDDGRFFFAIGRLQEGEIKITAGDQTKTFPIAKRDWKIQKIKGLPKNKVTPSKTEMARAAKDNAAILKTRTRKTETLYLTDFVWPVTGRISGVFGSQRVLNGKPKSPHRGVDVAAPTGTPILAPADGIVSLTYPDMFYSGNVVMIDHGHGISSVYVHLDTITAKEGDHIKQGEQLGTVGMTGRATGPHLHWGVNWYKVAVDPALLVPEMPAQTATN